MAVQSHIHQRLTGYLYDDFKYGTTWEGSDGSYRKNLGISSADWQLESKYGTQLKSKRHGGSRTGISELI